MCDPAFDWQKTKEMYEEMIVSDQVSHFFEYQDKFYHFHNEEQKSLVISSNPTSPIYWDLMAMLIEIIAKNLDLESRLMFAGFIRHPYYRDKFIALCKAAENKP